MKKTLLILLTSILPVGSVSAQVAQRVTKIIVGYPAGGGTDALARSLAQSLAAKWDQTVLVENKVGAAGALASEYVSKAAGDGLTLLFTDAAPIVILPNLKPEMTAIVGRLAPIAVAGRQTPALAINGKIPAKNLLEFIEYAKKNPGIAYGTAGVGSYFHIAMEQVQQRAGIKLLHVPYKGVPPMLTDLIGGEIKLTFATMPSLDQFDKDKRLKILAVATEKRTPLRPDIPTMAESGLPDFAIRVWFGVFAPAGTPADIQDKLNADLNSILNDPNFAKSALNPQFVTASTESRNQFAATVKADTERWAQLIRTLNIKPD